MHVLSSSRLAALMLAVAALFGARAGAAQAALTVDSVTASSVNSQAGAVSDFDLDVALSGGERSKAMTIDLPRGLMGNPQAVPRCSAQQIERVSKFLLGCPAASLVGTVQTTIDFDPSDFSAGGPVEGQVLPGRVFNMETRGDEAARLGVIFDPSALAPFRPIKVEASIGLRSTIGDEGLRAVIPTLPGCLLVLGDVPHACPIIRRLSLRLLGQPPSAFGGLPFMVNGSSCQETSARVAVLGLSGASATGEGAVKWSGCESLGVAGGVGVSVSRSTPDAPAAYAVSLDLPSAGVGAQSHLRGVRVTLPEGTSLSAGVGHDLDACSDAGFGRGSGDPAVCPAGSRLGTVDLDTPLLGVLHGSVYLGAPRPDVPLRMLLVVEGHGVRVKLVGQIVLDQRAGRVTAVFDDLPQVPFTHFRLRLRGGDRAVLRNPSACGAHAMSATFTGWSGAMASASSSLSIAAAPGHPCAADAAFAPRVSGGISPASASSAAALGLAIEQPDGEQHLRGLTLRMPPNASGSLSEVPACATAAAAAGQCPAASRVGGVRVLAGTGAAPYELNGSIYLTGPYRGAPAGLAIVIKVAPGPLDFGQTVVMAQVQVRSTDAGITVVTDDLPETVAGIPVIVRWMGIDLDREGFLRNGTSCAPSDIEVETRSAEGRVASARLPVNLTGCASLPFSPQLAVGLDVTGGQAQPRGHARLSVEISQSGRQAASHTIAVTLPADVGPDLTALARACTAQAFDESKCPPSARFGSATAVTPVLVHPLQGAVYFVKSANGGLPSPTIALAGDGINLTLRGHIVLTKDNRVQAIFDTVPDVPITRFTLILEGGKGGILVNARALCWSSSDQPRIIVADGAFTAHSSATDRARVAGTVTGCPALATTTAVARSRDRVIVVTRHPGAKPLKTITVTVPKSARVTKASASVAGKARPRIKTNRSHTVSTITVASGDRVQIKLRTVRAVDAKKIVVTTVDRANNRVRVRPQARAIR